MALGLALKALALGFALLAQGAAAYDYELPWRVDKDGQVMMECFHPDHAQPGDWINPKWADGQDLQSLSDLEQVVWDSLWDASEESCDSRRLTTPCGDTNEYDIKDVSAYVCFKDGNGKRTDWAVQVTKELSCSKSGPYHRTVMGYATDESHPDCDGRFCPPNPHLQVKESHMYDSRCESSH